MRTRRCSDGGQAGIIVRLGVAISPHGDVEREISRPDKQDVHTVDGRDFIDLLHAFQSLNLCDEERRQQIGRRGHRAKTVLVDAR